jgi:hypothetical protein
VLEQRRFADAGFAPDHQAGALPHPGGGEGLIDLAELSPSADQHRYSLSNPRALKTTRANY